MPSTFTVGLIIDIIIVVIFLLNILLGYFRGFIKMLFGFINLAAAFAAAYIFARPLSALLKNTPVYNGIFSGLKSSMTSYFESLSEKQLNDIMSAEAEKSGSYFENFGRSISDISGEYARLAADKGADATENLVDYIIEPACEAIVVAICFILIFIVSFILIKLIGSLLNLAAKLPVIKGVNRFLGVLAGIILAVMQVILFTVIVDALLPCFDLSQYGITLATVRESHLYSFFASVNPLDAVFGRYS